MSWAKEIGRIGEQMVADYLKTQGYFIARMNFRSNYGEIDIVAEKADIVVFVEVKTRAENALLAPADAVDTVKRKRIAKTAESFLKRAHLRLPYRFDIAEVTYKKKDNGEYSFALNYIKSAFTASLENYR